MPKSRDEVCQLMDKLLLHSLELMEQEVRLKTTIEAVTNDGQLDLAHTRFTKGAHTVSAVQLPTEDYRDFSALNSLTENRDELGQVQLSLDNHPVDKETGHIDPIRWFGILIPATLQSARTKFGRALEYVVECGNVQIQLRNVLLNYGALKRLKAEL